MTAVAPESEMTLDRGRMDKLHHLTSLCPLFMACMRLVWCIAPDKKLDEADEDETPKTFAESYDSVKKIGSGAFAEVYLITDKLRGSKFAAKIIVTSSLNEIQKAEIHYEIEMLRRMNHPNVLALIDFFQDDENTHIVTNYCSGGELFDRYTAHRSARLHLKLRCQTLHCCTPLAFPPSPFPSPLSRRSSSQLPPSPG